MGTCQCIDVNKLCVEYEIYTELKDNNTEYNEEALLLNARNGKFRSSNEFNNFSNFKKFHHKDRKILLNKLNESNKSEILLEDLSNISKTVENNVDYYQNSKIIFDSINDIRIDPDKFIFSCDCLINDLNMKNFLNEPLNTLDPPNGKEIRNINQTGENFNNIKSEDTGHYINSVNYQNTNNFNDLMKNYFKDENLFSKLIELKDSIKNIFRNNKGKTDIILWSEKVYLSAYEYLIEVEEKFISNSDLLKKSTSQRISEKLQNNSNCIEFNVNGFYNPLLIVLYLLMDNIDRLKQILIDNHDYGAACIFPTKYSSKARTLIYFAKKKTKNTFISGINPITGKPHRLLLNESLFNSIDYKHLIEDGNYNSDGTKLQVTFNLSNGEDRKEEFNLS